MAGLDHYAGTYVILKESIPADKRGVRISQGTRLFVSRVDGQYLWLNWPDGKRASRDGVHYSKLKTG